MPKVSIGMPVYNGERFVGLAIESILSQSYNDFELIISDNASTDRTAAICMEYAARDSRVLFCRNQQNLGAARNFNLVFKLAKGEYFKWAPHDDMYEPNCLLRCVEVLDNNRDVVLCYPQTKVIDENGKLIMEWKCDNMYREQASDKRFAKMILNEQACYPVLGLMRSSILKHTALIGSYCSSDRVLLAELALMGCFHEISEPLIYRRELYPGNHRFKTRAEKAEWFDTALKNHIIFPSWKQLREYLRAVKRARLDLAARFSCYGSILRWGWRSKKKLASELAILPMDAAKQLFRR